MPRRQTGQVLERTGRHGTTYALRFMAYGRRRRLNLGAATDGWTRRRAEDELANVLADVRRGTWTPPPVAAAEYPEDPTFHEFASSWWSTKRLEVTPNTRNAYEYELSLHLLPFFQDHRLADITIQEVDRYRAYKLRVWNAWQARPAHQRPHAQRPPGPPMINKTITRLAQILEDAVEYGLIDRNPARGKRRRVKVKRRQRPHLDRAAQIEAVLEAARQLDQAARPDRRHIARLAFIAVLVLGGLRIEEAVGLRWRHIDLAAGRMQVGETKTEAGERQIDLLPALATILHDWRERSTRVGPQDYVFATLGDKRTSKDNLRTRVVGPTFRAADALLVAAGEVPLPEDLTPHGLRHTFASILVALGENPIYVMEQLGHTDPAFTLRLYTHAMRRDGDELERLKRAVGRH